MSYGFGGDFEDHKHLICQWDRTLKQLGSVNPYRVAVFSDRSYQTGCSPYAIDVDRVLDILGYFPVTSYDDNATEVHLTILNPSDLNVAPILMPENWAILIDLSSDRIIFSGKIEYWHKYPHGTASKMQMNKEAGPINYAEFVEDSLRALAETI